MRSPVATFLSGTSSFRWTSNCRGDGGLSARRERGGEVTPRLSPLPPPGLICPRTMECLPFGNNSPASYLAYDSRRSVPFPLESVRCDQSLAPPSLPFASRFVRSPFLSSFFFAVCFSWSNCAQPKPSNYFAEVEQSAFAPSRIVPGIDFSPDKMLLGVPSVASPLH